MYYKAVPSKFVSVESGRRSDAPPMRACTDPVHPAEALLPPDDRNVVVISLEDLELRACNEMTGASVKPIIQYAMTLNDAGSLLLQLLLNLSRCGHPYARKLVERFSGITEELVNEGFMAEVSLKTIPGREIVVFKDEKMVARGVGVLKTGLIPGAYTVSFGGSAPLQFDATGFFEMDEA